MENIKEAEIQKIVQHDDITQASHIVQKSKSKRARVKNFVKENWLLIFGVLYVLSPFDILPEAILGPLGLVDDIGVMTAILIQRWRG